MPSTPRLDEQICFALYSASRAITARYRELLDPLGITYPQYLVLLVLWERDRVTLRDVGERLDLDSGTLSPLVRRMERAGLVVRTRRTTDERLVEVALTDEGSALRVTAADIPAAVCASTGLDRAAIDELRERITELGSHVRAA